MQYVIMISGTNVLLREDRKRRRLGFVTTRVVSAADRDEACRLAIESAREELLSKIANDPSNPPSFEVEPEIRVFEDGDEVTAPRRGFTFYPE
jgi:hypothetical protein